MKFKILIILASLLCINIGLTSCDNNEPPLIEKPGDDDDPYDNTVKERINIKTYNDYLFSGISGLINVFYDYTKPYSKKRYDVMVNFKSEYSHEDIFIKYNDIQLDISSTSDYYPQMKFTPQGFVSEFTYSTNKSGAGNTWSSSEDIDYSYSFQYDSAGHLKGYAYEIEEVYDSSSNHYEDIDGFEEHSHYHSSETVNATIELTWENNNLVKVEISKDITSIDNENKTNEQTYFDVYEISYGEVENPVRQFPFSLARICFDNNLLCGLPTVGLFGVGTAKMPVCIIHTNSKGKTEELDIVAVMKNVDGLTVIGQERYNDNKYRYQYTKK